MITLIIVAVLTSIITSMLMIWMFTAKPSDDEFSLFDAEITHTSTGVIPVVSYGSTNPLACNECDYLANSKRGLAIHKGRRHKV